MVARKRKLLKARANSIAKPSGRWPDAFIDYLASECRLAENTIVIFTADHGAFGLTSERKPLRGAKADLYEGGVRVPTIAWWPGKIKAGSESDHVSAFWDVMPTVADIIDVESPANIDGISFLPSLIGGKQDQHEYMYWEFHERGGRQALRKGDWKLIETFETGGLELFDLSQDQGEQLNLAEKRTEEKNDA